MSAWQPEVVVVKCSVLLLRSCMIRQTVWSKIWGYYVLFLSLPPFLISKLRMSPHLHPEGFSLLFISLCLVYLFSQLQRVSLAPQCCWLLFYPLFLLEQLPGRVLCLWSSVCFVLSDWHPLWHLELILISSASFW